MHVAPAETLSNEEVVILFFEGMKKLAGETKKDGRIKHIKATSTLIVARPKAFRYAGFTLEGPITDEERTAHFADETRPVAWASMSRETLLEKYGNVP